MHIRVAIFLFWGELLQVSIQIKTIVASPERLSIPQRPIGYRIDCRPRMILSNGLSLIDTSRRHMCGSVRFWHYRIVCPVIKTGCFDFKLCAKIARCLRDAIRKQPIARLIHFLRIHFRFLHSAAASIAIDERINNLLIFDVSTGNTAKIT